jgi:hypothetical protein
MNPYDESESTDESIARIKPRNSEAIDTSSDDYATAYLPDDFT